jgi:hypothetical protein
MTKHYIYLQTTNYMPIGIHGITKSCSDTPQGNKFVGNEIRAAKTLANFLN